MKSTFVKLRDMRFIPGIEYPWLLKVTSVEQLLVYETLIQKSRIIKAITETLDSREFQYAACIASGPLKNHTINRLTYPILFRAENKGLNVINATVDLFDEIFRDKLKALNKYDCLYIQPCGSYFFPSDTHVILKTKELDKCIFPDENEIQYIKWPNGKHWYAKVGNKDVKVDGIMKWNTKEAAEEAVKTFMKENKKLFEKN